MDSLKDSILKRRNILKTMLLSSKERRANNLTKIQAELKKIVKI
jgi:hypothetical protein